MEMRFPMFPQQPVQNVLLLVHLEGLLFRQQFHFFLFSSLVVSQIRRSSHLTLSYRGEALRCDSINSLSPRLADPVLVPGAVRTHSQRGVLAFVLDTSSASIILRIESRTKSNPTKTSFVLASLASLYPAFSPARPSTTIAVSCPAMSFLPPTPYDESRNDMYQRHFGTTFLAKSPTDSELLRRRRNAMSLWMGATSDAGAEALNLSPKSSRLTDLPDQQGPSLQRTWLEDIFEPALATSPIRLNAGDASTSFPFAGFQSDTQLHEVLAFPDSSLGAMAPSASSSSSFVLQNVLTSSMSSALDPAGMTGAWQSLLPSPVLSGGSMSDQSTPSATNDLKSATPPSSENLLPSWTPEVASISSTYTTPERDSSRALPASILHPYCKTVTPKRKLGKALEEKRPPHVRSRSEPEMVTLKTAPRILAYQVRVREQRVALQKLLSSLAITFGSLDYDPWNQPGTLSAGLRYAISSELPESAPVAFSTSSVSAPSNTNSASRMCCKQRARDAEIRNMLRLNKVCTVAISWAEAERMQQPTASSPEEQRSNQRGWHALRDVMYSQRQVWDLVLACEKRIDLDRYLNGGAASSPRSSRFPTSTSPMGRQPSSAGSAYQPRLAELLQVLSM